MYLYLHKPFEMVVLAQLCFSNQITVQQLKKGTGENEPWREKNGLRGFQPDRPVQLQEWARGLKCWIFKSR